MRTRYSEDQQAVGEAFGELFARESTAEAIRAAEAGCGFDRGLWDKLALAGAPGMAAPATDGGGGASLVDLAVVVYEWGRRIAPVPLVEHAVVARLLCAGASRRAPDGLREAVVSGELVATLALRPAEAGGTARLVPAGAVAGVVAGLRGGDLVLGRGEPPGRARPNTADLPLADRDLSAAVVLASGESAREAFDAALTEWKALMSVAYTGLASEVLAMGVAYVKQRHQFGVPVGSFQAVQHGLADAATRAEGARLLAFRAACAVDAADAGAPRLASMALLLSAESARFASDRVLQYHGGYGYSAEYDVQLYYRRAAAWLLQLGDPAAEVARLADAELGHKIGAA
ncbi:MAG: acyl-CoA dehydrogenase [Acidimicrobiaceae bacterium]|nr:acyl-CoA dehydrogenase [Acidimicrobiaceae bacterium]MXZ66269.1 acyl-CoA dehydrogenase [Acidimicrobiaceae bacterium]MYF32374.1 acyl-CoA dehydrogenase [Acidimicrobiaceae bacterium]MYG77466.1 acyl-CoA dehydrogenase [Acidimicrobiaceae bacterium]MYJ28440.1 acyl-CoA dehydrogenase [Acidimicrobiaceae bacterium]